MIHPSYLGLVAMVNLMSTIELSQSLIEQSKCCGTIRNEMRHGIMLHVLDRHGVVNANGAVVSTYEIQQEKSVR